MNYFLRFGWEMSGLMSGFSITGLVFEPACCLKLMRVYLKLMRVYLKLMRVYNHKYLMFSVDKR